MLFLDKNVDDIECDESILVFNISKEVDSVYFKNAIILPFELPEFEKDVEQNQRLKTKTTNINEKIKNLSGGNQQKVIIARWLLKNSDIFIFDEPTRGIDIGAKSDIYSLIKKLAEQNKSVIVISSEFNEIKNLADRVLVMSEGEITKELNIHEITQENVIKYSMKRA